VTCPKCGCDLGSNENVHYLECGICSWSGAPVDCYGKDDEPDDDEEPVA